MKNITVLGIDIAKKVFQLHGVDEPRADRRAEREKGMLYFAHEKAAAPGTKFTAFDSRISAKRKPATEHSSGSVRARFAG